MTAADDDRVIADLAERGRQAWPELAADRAIGELVRRKADGRPIAEAARELDPAELYLAAAFAGGDRAAPAAFEARYFGAVDAMLASAGASRSEIDEIRQVLRTRLLVPGATGELPLVDYAGGGRLGGLLRVSATRIYLNLRTRERPTDGDGDLAERVASELDPRREVLAEQERADVAAALRDAAQALDRRLRTMLRLHVVHRMSIDRLAEVFEVHRATAARQLARAREELIAGVRERLAARWGSGVETLSLVSSRLELSFDRLLATAA